MLDSEYIKFYCGVIPSDPYPTKIQFFNESDYEVRYEVKWYKEKVMTEGSVGISAAGGGGNAGAKWESGDKAEPDEGFCDPHGPPGKITVMSGYKYYRLKYNFVDLENGWTEEHGKVLSSRTNGSKNFGIYEKIIFKQPSSKALEKYSSKVNKKLIEDTISEKLDSIQNTVNDICLCVSSQNSLPKPVPKITKVQEPEITKVQEPKITKVQECGSLSKHMCSSGNKRKQCPHCKYWYCDWHFKVNNNTFGRGGHMCETNQG
tara:strand:- start:237 stop:1019 length:783 start_codon:yes stop_codon:yes gene_type:complete